MKTQRPKENCLSLNLGWWRMELCKNVIGQNSLILVTDRGENPSKDCLFQFFLACVAFFSPRCRAGPLWNKDLQGRREKEDSDLSRFYIFLWGRGTVLSMTHSEKKKFRFLSLVSGEKEGWETGRWEKVRKTLIPKPSDVLQFKEFSMPRCHTWGYHVLSPNKR